MKTLAILTLLFVHSAYAQINVREARYKDGDQALWKALNGELGRQMKVFGVTNSCLSSVTFAQFTISKNGDIVILDFYDAQDTPPAFRQLLSSVIKATKGRWQSRIVNGEAVDSRPFLLPLLYKMEGGCSPGKETYNTGYESMRELLGFDYDLKRKAIVPRQLQLDCVLLRPIYMFSSQP